MSMCLGGTWCGFASAGCSKREHPRAFSQSSRWELCTGTAPLSGRAAQHSHTWILEVRRGMCWGDMGLPALLPPLLVHKQKMWSQRLAVFQRRGSGAGGDVTCPIYWQAASWMFSVMHCKVSALLTTSLLVKASKGWGGSH